MSTQPSDPRAGLRGERPVTKHANAIPAEQVTEQTAKATMGVALENIAPVVTAPPP